jgi:hypothetical protein
MSYLTQVRPAVAAGIMALSLPAAAACSSAVSAVSRPTQSPVAASPSTPSSPSASPESAGAALARPSDVKVAFSGLRAGTFPVHVHSRCSANQAFHIVVVESLRVNSMGTGAIEVPRGYFGRGLCLIVYANQSLSAVLTTRPI